MSWRNKKYIKFTSHNACAPFSKQFVVSCAIEGGHLVFLYNTLDSCWWWMNICCTKWRMSWRYQKIHKIHYSLSLHAIFKTICCLLCCRRRFLYSMNCWWQINICLQKSDRWAEDIKKIHKFHHSLCLYTIFKTICCLLCCRRKFLYNVFDNCWWRMNICCQSDRWTEDIKKYIKFTTR